MTDGKGWVGKNLSDEEFLQLQLDWSLASFVIVSASGTNPCGHAMLALGRDHYFHVPGIPLWYERPFYMDGAGFQLYLDQHKVKELARTPIVIPCPQKAASELRKLMQGKWPYGIVISNCVTFIQEVAAAGGNFWDFVNCPKTQLPDSQWMREKVHPLFQANSCSVETQ